MPIRNNLPGSRKRWALTQREVAHLVGVSASVLSRYETGTLSPGARAVLALEIVFGRRGRHLFPSHHQDIEDAVMRRAALLDRTLRGKQDAASDRKRAFLSAMINRGDAAKGA